MRWQDVRVGQVIAWLDPDENPTLYLVVKMKGRAVDVLSLEDGRLYDAYRLDDHNFAGARRVT